MKLHPFNFFISYENAYILLNFCDKDNYHARKDDDRGTILMIKVSQQIVAFGNMV